MNTRIAQILKRHWFNILFVFAFAVLVFNPDAKAWLLRQLFAIGLFQPELPRKEAPASVPAHVDLVLKDAQGAIVTTSKMKGKVLFINFWASWCPPCRAEMPSINALYNKLKDDKRYAFLMIDVDGFNAKSQAYLQQHHFSFPVYTLAGDVPQDLYKGTLPTTLVVNSKGEMVLQQEGVANYNTQEFLSRLKQL